MKSLVSVCLLIGALGGGAAITATPAASQSQSMMVMPQEPRAGGLLPGQSVLVDDKTCPTGQIKMITGGNKATHTKRSKKCIPRPA